MSRKTGWFWYATRPVRTAFDAHFAFERRKRLVEAMDKLAATIVSVETLTGRATLTKLKHYAATIAKIDTTLSRWLWKQVELERSTKRRKRRKAS